MAKFRIDIDTLDAVSQLDRIEAAKGSINGVINLLSGIEGGVIDADLDVLVSPVSALATVTFTATGQVADETITIDGVAFTAKDSGATGAQFNISTTDAEVTALNFQTAVAASASTKLAGVIVATVSGAVVTLTAVSEGAVGMGNVLTESMTAVTAVDFASGSDGTSYTLSSK